MVSLNIVPTGNVIVPSSVITNVAVPDEIRSVCTSVTTGYGGNVAVVKYPTLFSKSPTLVGTVGYVGNVPTVKYPTLFSNSPTLVGITG